MKIYKLILAGLLAFSLLCHGAIFWAEKSNIAAGYGDFIIFYTGAQIVNAGRGADLYNLTLQRKVQDEFHIPIRKGPLPYNHLPYELLLFLPLAALPYLPAYLVWTAINLALLAGIFRLLGRLVNDEHRILVAALLLAFYPTTVALLHGQDSILSTFLLMGAFTCFKSKRDASAGIMLGLGLYKPQLVLPIAGLLLLKRRWRAVLGFGATASVLAVISIAMIGWGGVADYLTLLSWMDRTHYTIAPSNMANFRGLTEIAAKLLGFAPTASKVILPLIYIPLYTWAVCLWKGGWRPEKNTFDFAFSHIIVISLLVSYHLYVHDLILLVIPLVVMANDVLGARTHGRLGPLSFLLLLLLFYNSLVALWLLKLEVFAWAACALIVLALLFATELRARDRRERDACGHSLGGAVGFVTDS